MPEVSARVRAVVIDVRVHARLECLGDVRFVARFGDADDRADDVDHQPVRNALAVRDALAVDPARRIAVPFKSGAELGEQPALPHPRLAGDARDPALAGPRDLELLPQLLQLRVAADHRRADAGQPARVHRTFLQTRDLVGVHRFRLALQLEPADVDRLDEGADEAIGRGSDEDAARPR